MFYSVNYRQIKNAELIIGSAEMVITTFSSSCKPPVISPPGGRGVAHRQRRWRGLRAEEADVVAGEYALSRLLASPRTFPSHGYIFRYTNRRGGAVDPLTIIRLK
eukprot:6200805-Pleurochrysis_carterae.AAC.1